MEQGRGGGGRCYASVKKRSHSTREMPLRFVSHGQGRSGDFEEQNDPKNQKITTLVESISGKKGVGWGWEEASTRTNTHARPLLRVVGILALLQGAVFGPVQVGQPLKTRPPALQIVIIQVRLSGD